MNHPEAFQDLLRQLRQNYLAELPERLENIERSLLAFEREGLSPEGFQDLFRQVHSLKGSGGTYGVYDLTTICHQLEDLLSPLNGVPRLDTAQGQSLLGHVDLLRQVVQEAMDGLERRPDLEARLLALRPVAQSRPPVALLVDDTRVFIGVCSAVLQEAGLEVRVIQDGYQALMPALRQPFDLILSVAEPPGLSGLALIAAVKLSSLTNRTTPCVLLTGNPTRWPTEGTGFGPDRILRKDRDLPEQLRALLKALLKR